jgi:hypothetical protein
MSFSGNKSRRVRRRVLSITVAGQSYEFKLHPWTSVNELKQQIASLLDMPAAKQRLFLGAMELSNAKLLEDYHVFDSKEHCLRVQIKQATSSSASLHPLCTLPTESFLPEINQALALGLAPNLTMDGTGGTYILRGTSRKPLAVFKPLDEEPFAPLNPRNYVGMFGSHGFRNGVLSGEAGYREVAAYSFDHDHFGGVPCTVLAEIQHGSFNYPMTSLPWPKLGSLQVFEPSKGSSEDFASSRFSKHEVHKIAILDIRYLNMDRNESNILVTHHNSLIPIDHGLTFPDTLEICIEDLCWMSWPQVREPLSEVDVEYVRRLDALADMTMIQRLFCFTDAVLKNYRAAHIVLKKGVAAGLTLHQIGGLIYRPEFDSVSSKLEEIISKAEKLYKAASRSRANRIEHKFLEPPKPTSSKRDRAMSDNDLEFMFGSQFAVSSPTCSTASLTESPEAIITISEETDEEVLDNSKAKRVASLPDFSEFMPRSLEREVSMEDLAFNDVFFFYVETFIEQEIQTIFKNQTGRVRSYSMAVESSLPMAHS